MINLVNLEYSFIFTPDTTLTTKYEMDKMLADFFKSKGYQAELVQTGPYTASKMFYLTPIELPMNEPKEAPEKSIKQVKADLTRKQGFDGKFVKTK